MKKCKKCGIEKEYSMYQKNKKMADGYLSYCKKCMNRVVSNPEFKAYMNSYRIRYKDKIKERYSIRMKNDPIFNLSKKVRSRLNTAMLRKYSYQYRKKNKTEVMLGIPFALFKIYIESKFTKGMKWENLLNGEIHLDHKIPLSSAKTEEELVALCHYTNLQPLWAKDNMAKSDKIFPTQMIMTI